MTCSREKYTIIFFSIIFLTSTTKPVISTSLQSPPLPSSSPPSSSLSLNDKLHCPEQCTCTITTTNNNLVQNHAKCDGLDGLKNESIKSLSLHSLDLSNINLTRIPYTLEKLKDLMTLDLSFNNLSEIGHFSKRMQKLNISHNKITSGKLSNLPVYLKYLDLSHNEITYLPSELKNLKYLRSIELSGNKIHCSCETLDVRNWLQNSNVWTDNHIKCVYPIEVKGKSWLQIRQSDVCDNNQKAPNDDDENELMLGDEAFHDDGSGDVENNELGSEYLPIDGKNEKNLSHNKNDTDETNVEGSGGGDVVDSSSSIAHTNLQSSVEMPYTEHQQDFTSEHSEHEHDSVGQTEPTLNYSSDIETTEASGVGPLPAIISVVDNDDDNDKNTISSTTVDAEEVNENIVPLSAAINENFLSSTELLTTPASVLESTPTPILQPESTSEKDIFGPGLGIAQLPNFMATSEEPLLSSEQPLSSSEQPAEEPLIVPVTAKNVESEIPVPVTSRTDGTLQSVEIQKANIKAVSEEDPNDVVKAKSGESNATYTVLGILLVLLIVLILFVAIKRNRTKRRCRRQQDAENPKETELIDMDKKNVGKPIHKNGAAEHTPLINDRTKSDLAKPINANGKKMPFESNDKNAQEPLLKNDESTLKDSPQTESNNNVPNNKSITKPTTISTPKTDSVEELTKIEEQKPQHVTPVPAVRQSIASKPSEPSVHQYKYPPPTKPKPSAGDEGDGYNSSSPRPSRYSPVYSPETGRVKIKLTETPKPKTPLLVTRSRSNAGDIITTPTSKIEMNNTDVTKSPKTDTITTTNPTTTSTSTIATK